ncbi:kinesin-like protein [Cryptosporidium xiaoi]|uniref:Kinesin-like protein n=1 Tax=Cryptosporidium xiaoi TaxID=659607 RepID=A0AAV9Y0T8_9CRYT
MKMRYSVLIIILISAFSIKASNFHILGEDKLGPQDKNYNQRPSFSCDSLSCTQKNYISDRQPTKVETRSKINISKSNFPDINDQKMSIYVMKFKDHDDKQLFDENMPEIPIVRKSSPKDKKISEKTEHHRLIQAEFPTRKCTIESIQIPLTPKGFKKTSPIKDLRLDLMEHDEMVNRSDKDRRIKEAFDRKKLEERIEAEGEFSIIDPEEDQIEVFDDTELYDTFEPGEEKLMKFPRKVKSVTKIAIRQHPEIEGYKTKDIEYERMKEMKFKEDQELEFIESSEEAKKMFETAGSPFRNIKKKNKHILEDEDLVVLDMPLEYTPDGLRDIVEAYFWTDFQIFDYNEDMKNPQDNLVKFFETYPKFDKVSKIDMIKDADIINPGLGDLIGISLKKNKTVREIIAERRDLVTVKDRPYSLIRSFSKGFENIFLRRNSRKIKEKFLLDFKNIIIEWSGEYDLEYPMISPYPLRSKNFKIIRTEPNVSKEIDDIKLRGRKEFVHEMFGKNENKKFYDDYFKLDIKLSKKLFPELEYDDIPDIKGVPVDYILILSSTGVIPDLLDFDKIVSLIRNELMEAERKKVAHEDPLDPKLLKRHVLRKELPPISATEDEIITWEIEQREKESEDEYDEFGHRRVKLRQLPINTYIDTPKIEYPKPIVKKPGKVVLTDEEVERMRKNEREFHPIMIKKTDKKSRESEIKRINSVLEKKDALEAELRRIPGAFIKKTKEYVDLKSPYTMTMIHTDNNFNKSIQEQQKLDLSGNLHKDSYSDSSVGT